MKERRGGGEVGGEEEGRSPCETKLSKARGEMHGSLQKKIFDFQLGIKLNTSNSK